MDQTLILKFVKFCVVGFTGLLLDFGVTFLLREKVKVNSYLANASGFILAAISNYILNRIYTFQSHNENVSSEFFSFFIISILGLGINTIFLWIFREKVKLNFYVAKAIAIGITTIWNFTANFIFTFA